MATLVALIVMLPAIGAYAATSADQPSVADLDEREVDSHLLAALHAEGKAGLLEYHGDCPVSESDDIRLQMALSVSPVAGQTLPLLQLFAAKDRVAVREFQPGMVVMATRGVWQDLMQVKLTHVEFDSFEQYDPFMAILAVVNSPSMAMAMKHIQAKPLALPLDRISPPPAPGQPHIDGSLDNVTVDEAINRILRIFHGLVVYKECVKNDGSHWFSIYFYP